MPIPLPNLDTRHWADLVEEGRSLIPHFAPNWTDHNAHDPGITLMELFAWLVEQDIYRVNRISDRHRRKFLSLVGFSPTPPRPSKTVLSFRLAPGVESLRLPEGLVFAARTNANSDVNSAGSLIFRTTLEVALTRAELVAVQVFDGSSFVDQSKVLTDNLAFQALGAEPQAGTRSGPDSQPALYLGLNSSLPVDGSMSLYLSLDGSRASQMERERIINEQEEEALACMPTLPACSSPAPLRASAWCAPEDNRTNTGAASGSEAAPSGISVGTHHAVKTVWEYYGDPGWVTLRPEAKEIDDKTRGLTLDGMVSITLPGPMRKVRLGAIDEERYYLRCRLVRGPYDAAPVITRITVNAVEAEQRVPCAVFSTKRDPSPPMGAPEPRLCSIPMDDGSYEGSGEPNQQFTLRGAPIADGVVRLWTQEAAKWHEWQQVPDFDASSRTQRHFLLNPTTGQVTLGDGERGQALRQGATLWAAYETTIAAQGNTAQVLDWALLDNKLNRGLLGSKFDSVQTNLHSITNSIPATGGRDEEDIKGAASRAVATLWAHERLLDLCPPGRCETLDRFSRREVIERQMPERASTLLDFERLALDVPGTHVARARAWAGIDPQYPCLKAPGTVTVVVLPDLPAGRPQPSQELLGAVHRYLDRRRTIGTRLLVTGPHYLDVSVQATVRLKAHTDPERARIAIVSRLREFLHPLVGGPDRLGWPFGRDVYYSEILQVIDTVPGVDYIVSLRLLGKAATSSGAQESGTPINEGECGNLCVGPTWLVSPAEIEIEVKSHATR